jgi:hypothetical protein
MIDVMTGAGKIGASGLFVMIGKNTLGVLPVLTRKKDMNNRSLISSFRGKE